MGMGSVTTTRDIPAAHFEIIQSLQRDANDIPLVKGKPVSTHSVTPNGSRNSNGCAATSHVRLWGTNGSATQGRRGRIATETQYRDGTTHLEMMPLKFQQRRAALIPCPRIHLNRFHGGFAPNDTLQSQIVPDEVNPATDIAKRADDPPSASPRTWMS